jgi:hypothetical protein
MASRFLCAAIGVCLALILVACAAATTAPPSKPGFYTEVRDGRLWVFRDPSKELQDFKKAGEEPAQHATRVGGGPNGMTVKSPDVQTIDDYLTK